MHIYIYIYIYKIYICVCACVCMRVYITSTSIIILNDSKHIIIISKGSCDTEDWSNGLASFAL